MVEAILNNLDIWTTAKGLKSKGRNKSVDNISPYGIDKLRQLILDLAVRGKLVPQDPNDESVNLLLEKIANDKNIYTNLIESNKLPFNIPETWEWVRFKHLLDFQGGSQPPKNLFLNENLPGYVQLIQIRDLGPDPQPVYVPKDTVSKFCSNSDIMIGRYGASVGKVFWGKDGAYNVALIKLIDEFLVYNKDFLHLLMKSPIGQNLFLGVSRSAQAGFSKNDIAEKLIPLPPISEQQSIVAKVDELMVLCDQLQEKQEQSIFAHYTLVDTLLETLTSAKDADDFPKSWQRIAEHFDTLFTTEYSIDKLKQTILQLAVMGKLVPQDPSDLPAPRPGKWFVYVLECEDGSLYKGHTKDILTRWKQHATGKGAEWTKTHPPIRLVHWEEFDAQQDAVKRENELKTGFGRKWLQREIEAGRTRQAGEPAIVLLEKIAAEKEKLLKEGKIKKQKPIPEINENEQPFELPNGWEWARLGNLTDRIGSGSTPRGGKTAYSDSGIIFLRSQNVWNDGLKLDDVAYISQDIHNKMSNTIVYPNDILLNITGASLGRSTIFPEDLNEANVSQHVTIIRPTLSDIKSYLHLCILSPYTQKLVWGRQVGMAREGLSKKVLELFEIPLPPLDEQKHIVAKVDELFSMCNELKKQIEDAENIQVQLADAVVGQVNV